MAITLYHVGRRPGQTQFGLDTFTESYKANEAADVVLTDASVPQKGDTHPDYAFMFVSDRQAQETGPSACALEVVYTGCMKSSEGLPVLPPASHTCTRNVQSASSSSNGDPGSALLAFPVTVQFYASITTYNYVSRTNVCAGCVPPNLADAPCDPVVISVMFRDQSLRNYFGGDFTQLYLCTFFGYLDTDIVESIEIVAGQYWQNIETKSRVFITKPAATSPIDGCPALGACTGVLGDCVITTSAVCTALGGTYHGDGSSCGG